MRTDCVLDTLIAAGLDNAHGKKEETEKENNEKPQEQTENNKNETQN